MIRRRPVAPSFDSFPTPLNGNTTEWPAQTNGMPSAAPPQYVQPAYVGLLLDDEELQKKLNRCNWKRNCTYFISVWSIVWFLLLSTVVLSGRFAPQYFILPPPAPLEGALSSNNLLNYANRLLANEIKSPESIFIDDRAIYASSADGRVLKIQDGAVADELYLKEECKTKHLGEFVCGRPIGIRKWKGDTLVVVDAYNGLYTMDFVTRKVELLVSTSATADDLLASEYMHDVSVIDDEHLVITERSGKHKAAYREYDRMEHVPSGRVLLYDADRKRLTVLVGGLFEPTGVQVLDDKDTILIAETGTASILSYSLSTKHLSMWSNKLPGLPSHIRLTPDKKHVWVAFEEPRIHEQGSTTSLAEHFQRWPFVRKTILTLFPIGIWTRFYESFIPPHALAAKFHLDGELVTSVQAPAGIEKKGAISEVHETQSHLFAVARQANYILRLPMHPVHRVQHQHRKFRKNP